MVKTSIFSWYSYPAPIEDRLRAIKEAGFDATMLWWDSDDKHLQPDLARNMGLEVENVHAPFRQANSFWLPGEQGGNYLDLLMDCVKDCAMHRIPTVVIHITGFCDPPEISQTGIDRVKRLIDLAETAGVNLAFENLSFLEHLDFIFGNFDSQRVGFCYDSGHENWNHPDDNCLSKYGGRLMALHLDDNFGNADTHLLPFDGNIDWGKIMGDLSKCRKLEYLSLEVDFNTDAIESEPYQKLSGTEFLQMALERVNRLKGV